MLPVSYHEYILKYRCFISMRKLHIISEVNVIAIFRNKAEQCGLSSIRNIDTEVHCTAVCVALIGTSEDNFVWTKWNRQNISRPETGRTFSAKVRLIMEQIKQVFLF